MAERYGMNMSQADADRVAWVVMAVIYALTCLPLGLLMIWASLDGFAGPKGVGYGLCLIVGPILERERIHAHLSGRR